MSASDIRTMLETLQDRGLYLVVASTDPLSLETKRLFEERGYPEFDLCLDRSKVGVSKGSQRWLEYASGELGVELWECFYVGDDDLDWRTAINGPVMYLNANWSKRPTAKMTCITVDRPLDVTEFAEHFLLSPSRFAFVHEDDRRGVHVRVLYPQSDLAQDILASTRPASGFSMIDILHHKKDVQVGKMKAQDLLMLHVVSSLQLRGEIERAALWTVYPGSDPGRPLKPVEEYLDRLSRTCHGYFLPDLLVRGIPGRDTSLARSLGKAVSMDDQLHTVHVNPNYSKRIRGKQVIVFDDFTTRGTSLELARNLLLAAGASQVVGLAAGKYGFRYTSYSLRPDVVIDPFSLETRSWEDVFTSQTSQLGRDDEAMKRVQASFLRQAVERG